MSFFVLDYKPPPDVATHASRFCDHVKPFLLNSPILEDARQFCWRWQGTQTRGRDRLPYFYFAGKNWPIQRFAYTLWIDTLFDCKVNGLPFIAKPLLCVRNEPDPLCVNPYHLLPVPQNYKPPGEDHVDSLLELYDTYLDQAYGTGTGRIDDDIAWRARIMLTPAIENRRRYYRSRLRDMKELIAMRRNRTARAIVLAQAERERDELLPGDYSGSGFDEL